MLAWKQAWDKGYVQDAVTRYAGADFWDIAKNAVIGIAGGLAAVFVCQVGGAAAGAGLAAYLTAGNPVAALAGGEIGATIGATIAEAGLTLLGVAFLVEFVKDHVWICGVHAVAAYDLIVNQAPVLAGQLFDLTIDYAARQMAEAIGVFCGLVLMALVLWVTKRIASSRQAQNFAELTNSFLNDKASRLLGWMVPRLSELASRSRNITSAAARTAAAGVPASVMSTLQAAKAVARPLLARLVNPNSRLMTCRSLAELHDAFVREGFELVRVEPYGPRGGWQIFWRRGNVLARFKTRGETGGPRANQPHLSIAYNDGNGFQWQNDLGKFTYDGRVACKAQSDPSPNARRPFSPTDFQGNPQRFILLPTNYSEAAVDAWAARTHFNAPAGFDLNGVGNMASADYVKAAMLAGIAKQRRGAPAGGR
jgi:hypothetical protein